MFSAEKGAMPLIYLAVDQYELFFQKQFPLYEYINVTKSHGYDFSISGAWKLYCLINELIATHQPVAIPSGYNDRLY